MSNFVFKQFVLDFKYNFYMKITINSSNNCYVEKLCEVGGLAYIIYNMEKKNKRYGINFLVAINMWLEIYPISFVLHFNVVTI